MKQKTFKTLLSGFSSQHLSSSLFLRNDYTMCSLASIGISYPCSFTLMSTAQAKLQNVQSRERVRLLLLPIFHFVSLLPSLKLLTPNINYRGRTAPLTSKVAFYIFIQQI